MYINIKYIYVMHFCRYICIQAYSMLAGCFALQSICPLSAPSSDLSDMAERLGRRSLKKMPGQMGEMQRKESANPRLLQRGARQRRNEQEQAWHEKSQEQQREQEEEARRRRRRRKRRRARTRTRRRTQQVPKDEIPRSQEVAP